MAYRDDRDAILNRAEALRRALDDAEQKRAEVEEERDALAAETVVLRAALVRAVSGSGVRRRRRPGAAVDARAAPLLAGLLAVLAFVLAAISASGGRAPAASVPNAAAHR